MRRLLLPLALTAALAIPPVASAADHTVVLSDGEITALDQLIDMGVKYGGLNVAGNADFLSKKLHAAPVLPPPPPPAPKPDEKP